MHSTPMNPRDHEVRGTLRWNEFEGGFWSLEGVDPGLEMGTTIVLQDFDPPQDAIDGSTLRARVVAHPELVDFLMAGTRVYVLEAELIS